MLLNFTKNLPLMLLLVGLFGKPISAQTVFNAQISSSSDDAEEKPVGGAPTLNSTDIELTIDNGTNQTIGLRFNNISIPKDAIISKAYIQFTTDEPTNIDPCQLTIKGQNEDNPSTFTTATASISSRPLTTESVVWNPTALWQTDGEAGTNQQTPDIKNIVQAIMQRTGWVSGNSLVFIINGNGARVAQSYDRAPVAAPKLVIEYTGGTNLGLAATPFPIGKNSEWLYSDKGTDLGTAWKDASYDDATWIKGPGSFGYGDPVQTIISYGPSSTNKYITTYFRKKFTVADRTLLKDTLLLNLMRDDGAVVYINGVEIVRSNMPTGTITSSTFATTFIGGADELTYVPFRFKKDLIVNGENIIAVEIHQNDVTSSDLSFDLELKNSPNTTLTSGGCPGGVKDHIGCFVSVSPSGKNQTLRIPSTHAFQVIFKQGDIYTKGSQATAPSRNDFTGFIPDKMTSSIKGHLAVNHENTSPGGVSMLDIRLDESNNLWKVDSSQAIDFTPVVNTSRNCSGGISPWETIVTGEETRATGDANNDGYEDFGWLVEINPKTNAVQQYGNGKPEKLWAMGRASHENVVFANDSLTAYWGEDATDGILYKFIADNKTNFSSGKLYALKLSSELVNSEPVSSIGDWILVPNTTQSDRNNTFSLAKALNGTLFNGIEDVEIGTLDKKIYFTAKGNSRVYRFKDNGSTVSEFKTFVGGTNYSINLGNTIVSEPWGTGNDNLTFDDKGNLWVLQDGGAFHLWLVRPDHTQQNPKVEIFATSPNGSEPTGMTFTPDYKYMFMSYQEPASTNTDAVFDAANNSVVFNKSTTIVIALKENLGNIITSSEEILNSEKESLISIYPNPSHGQAQVKVYIESAGMVNLTLQDIRGNELETISNDYLSQGSHTFTVKAQQPGIYFIKLKDGKKTKVQKMVVH